MNENCVYFVYCCVLHIWYVPYMKYVFVGWMNKLIIFPSTKLIPLPNFSISFLTLFLINWQRGCQGVLCFRILGPMKRMKPGIILPKGEKNGSQAWVEIGRKVLILEEYELFWGILSRLRKATIFWEVLFFSCGRYMCPFPRWAAKR